MRIENSGIRYSSFQELAKAYKIEPKSKVTKDTDKLNAQKKKFSASHKCRGCGKSLELLNGSNVMRCTNPACKGVKRTRKDKDGNEITYYVPSFDLLNEKGMDIAAALFGE